MHYFRPTRGGILAATGVGTLTIGGVAFNQLWILAVAVAAVAAGAVVVRVGWRRGKGISQ